MYLIILIILTPPLPPSQTNDVTLYVWQSFLSPLWAGTGMHVSSHTLACCYNLLALYCGTNVDQRLVIWLYMSNTISGPSPPHCSASLPAARSRPCSTCKSIVVFFVEFVCLFCSCFFFKNACERAKHPWHSVSAAVPVPVGGDRRGPTGLLQQTWTSMVVAGWCLLIHTEGWSCAHCTCSGLCMIVCLECCC